MEIVTLIITSQPRKTIITRRAVSLSLFLTQTDQANENCGGLFMTKTQFFWATKVLRSFPIVELQVDVFISVGGRTLEKIPCSPFSVGVVKLDPT